MKLWLDAHLPPKLVPWLRTEFEIEAAAVRDLGLRDSKDREIFDAARRRVVVVMTKDIDFVHLVERLGPPPQVLWLTLGNTSNRRLREVLARRLPGALALLRRGEPVVELTEV